MRKKLSDAIDDPVEINNLFKTLLENNSRMRKYVNKMKTLYKLQETQHTEELQKVKGDLSLQEEIVKLHEEQESQELTKLKYKNFMNDTQIKDYEDKLEKVSKVSDIVKECKMTKEQNQETIQKLEEEKEMYRKLWDGSTRQSKSDNADWSKCRRENKKLKKKIEELEKLAQS